MVEVVVVLLMLSLDTFLILLLHIRTVFIGHQPHYLTVSVDQDHSLNT